MLHFDQQGELKRTFLTTAVERNKNPQLRLKALQEIAAGKDAEAFDRALDFVETWPRDDKREGVKVVLQALAEKKIGRRDQANNWIWRCANMTREVHEEYAVQRWPETKRLLGLLVNSSGGAHARNARRLVHAARQQDRRLAAALARRRARRTPRRRARWSTAPARGCRASRPRWPASCCATSRRARASPSGGGARSRAGEAVAPEVVAATAEAAVAPDTGVERGALRSRAARGGARSPIRGSRARALRRARTWRWRSPRGGGARRPRPSVKPARARRAKAAPTRTSPLRSSLRGRGARRPSPSSATRRRRSCGRGGRAGRAGRRRRAAKPQPRRPRSPRARRPSRAPRPRRRRRPSRGRRRSRGAKAAPAPGAKPARAPPREAVWWRAERRPDPLEAAVERVRAAVREAAGDEAACARTSTAAG